MTVEGTAPAVRRTLRRWWSARALAVVLGLVVGIVVGRSIAYQTSQGGLSGAIGGGLWLYGTIFGLVVVIALVAIVTRLRHRAIRSVTRPMLFGTLALVGGAVLGNVSAAATGGVYRPPVQLEASGTVTLRLEGRAGSFQAVDESAATCRSVADGRSVREVTGLALGTLDGRHLRGTLFIDATAERPHADLWIDGADLPEGAAQPTWGGFILVSNASDGSSGAAAFRSLALVHDPKMPALPGTFPESLAGTFTWTCASFGGS